MPRDRPTMLLAVVVLVAVQAALCGGFAGLVAVELARGSAVLVGAAVFLVAFFLAVAAMLVACARGLWRGRRWARSPVLTWQVLLVVLAAGWLRVEASAPVAAVLGTALVVGLGLLLPSVVAATTGPAPSARGTGQGDGTR